MENKEEKRRQPTTVKDIARESKVSVTTVSQKKATMGRLAVDHLISNIKGESDYIVQRTILNPILVVRNSCGFRARGSLYELSENKVATLPMG